jgi:hypothetical protein
LSVSHKFFSGDFVTFSGDLINVQSKLLKCSPIRSCCFGRRNVPTLTTFLSFFKNRSFGGVDPPEGLENAPDILAQNFLVISIFYRNGCGLGWAEPKNGRIFLEIRKRGGANRVICGRRDGLGLATSTSRRPLRSRLPLGRASFLPGRVGKRVISGEATIAQKKTKHVRTSGFVVVRCFEAAGAVDIWLDDRREASAARTADAVVG